MDLNSSTVYLSQSEQTSHSQYTGGRHLKGAYLKANPSLSTHTLFCITLKRRQIRIHHSPFLLKLHKNPGSRKLLQIPKQFFQIKISNSTMLECTELFKCTLVRTFERPDCPQQMSVQQFTSTKEISQPLGAASFSVSST